MTPITTQSPTQPDAPEKRARAGRWVAGGLLLFVAWVTYVIIAAGSGDVLAEAVLPDGTILRLEAVTFGQKQTFVVQKSSSTFLQMLGLGKPEISAFVEFGDLSHQVGVWLTRRDPNTGEPLDLDWLSHCTAVDADGWEHAAGLVGRCHWDDPIRTPHQEALVRDQAPFQLLPAGKYREIVVGTFLPLFVPKDGRFPLQVYNTRGELVAEFDAPYPGAPPARQNWTPEPLPATQVAGDLAVTLQRFDWTPQPADVTVAEGRLPTVQLEPKVTINWQSAPSDDWSLISENIMAVEDGLGNMSFLDRCRLTPHVPAWKLGLLLIRKPEGRYEPHEEWDSGQIEVPAAGESRDLDLNGEVSGNSVQLVKVFAAGQHRFTIDAPSCLGSITPPLAQEGAGWKASAVHRPGHVDWTVESERPFVVWKQGPQQPMTLFSRAFDPGGKQIGIDEVYDVVYGNNTIVAILKELPDSGAFLFRPARRDSRSVYFLIDPPELNERNQSTNHQ